MDHWLTLEKAMQLSPVELRIINAMVGDHPAGGSLLPAQSSQLRVADRQSTGKGYFLLFEPVSERLRYGDLNDVVSIVISTNLPAPRDVVGFSLFIRGGAIGSFEGYTFGSEPWPQEPMENWLTLEELPITHQKAK